MCTSCSSMCFPYPHFRMLVGLSRNVEILRCATGVGCFSSRVTGTSQGISEVDGTTV